MNELTGYDWGAPLIVTPRTRIAEYELPRPNAVREAVIRGSGSDRSLYVADVSSNTMFRVNVETGARTTLQIPYAAPFGPHSLHKAADGSLWATPFFPTALSHLDVKTQQWRTWPLKTKSGEMSGIHDLSFTYDHVVRTDDAGRIWFSDIVNTGVGYLDPKDGQLEVYRAPPIPGRPGGGQLYGLAMTPDRTRTVVHAAHEWTDWQLQHRQQAVRSVGAAARECGPAPHRHQRPGRAVCAIVRSRPARGVRHAFAQAAGYIRPAGSLQRSVCGHLGPGAQGSVDPHFQWRRHLPFRSDGTRVSAYCLCRGKAPTCA